MQTTSAFIRVRFLHHDVQNDTIAFFPDINYNETLYGNDLKMCYSLLGQHSSCSLEYADQCRKATPEEAEPLKKELADIGYAKILIV